ncbi:MAG TPA: hypothetical protein VFU21_25760, partial [Kofleriaceae bacterium]|nr:hypothetical protein [Kofleriaceae bacterium]
MLRAVLAVLAGYLTMFVGVTTLFAFILFVGFGGMPDAGFRPPGWLLWLEVAASPIIALFGGYVCAWIARERPLRHAGALAAVILVMGAVSAAADGGEKPLWSVIAVPALAAIGALLGARLRAAHVKMSALAVALLVVGLGGCAQDADGPGRARPIDVDCAAGTRLHPVTYTITTDL